MIVDTWKFKELDDDAKVEAYRDLHNEWELNKKTLTALIKVCNRLTDY